MKRKKLLNEDVPQWVKDCCKKRKDRQCCNLVDDNKDGKEISKDVLKKLKLKQSKKDKKEKKDMNESYLKYVIREEIEKINEQGQPIMPRSGWKNKMIQVYNNFGCTGLQNRKQKFINNQAGLVPGYNERWRAMLQVKIDFMEYLQNRYSC